MYNPTSFSGFQRPRRPIDLGGSKSGTQARSELLRQTQEERKKREIEKKRLNAALVLQVNFSLLHFKDFSPFGEVGLRSKPAFWR